MGVFRFFGILVFAFWALQGCISTQYPDGPPGKPPSEMFKGVSLDDAAHAIMNDSIRDGWVPTEVTAERLVFRKFYPLTPLVNTLTDTNSKPQRFLDRHYKLVTRYSGVMVYGGVNAIIRKEDHQDTSTPFPDEYPLLRAQLEVLSKRVP